MANQVDLRRPSRRLDAIERLPQPVSADEVRPVLHHPQVRHLQRPAHQLNHPQPALPAREASSAASSAARGMFADVSRTARFHVSSNSCGSIGGSGLGISSSNPDDSGPVPRSTSVRRPARRNACPARTAIPAGRIAAAGNQPGPPAPAASASRPGTAADRVSLPVGHAHDLAQRLPHPLEPGAVDVGPEQVHHAPRRRTRPAPAGAAGARGTSAPAPRPARAPRCTPACNRASSRRRFPQSAAASQSRSGMTRPIRRRRCSWPSSRGTARRRRSGSARG